MRPHETPSGIAYPVNPWTGQPLSPVHMARVARLRSATEQFLQALHDLDGASVGTPFGDPYMARAFQKFDEATMLAVRAILEQER